MSPTPTTSSGVRATSWRGRSSWPTSRTIRGGAVNASLRLSDGAPGPSGYNQGERTRWREGGHGRTRVDPGDAASHREGGDGAAAGLGAGPPVRDPAAEPGAGPGHRRVLRPG